MAKRVSQGGHNIPLDVIYRRYRAGLSNLFKLYKPVVDYWALYDNSTCPSTKIACGWKDKPTEVHNEDLYNDFKNKYAREEEEDSHE